MPVAPVPPGFEGATPYLCCKDAARMLDFYAAAFGATETMRLTMPDGKIGHAEIKIGTAVVMLADEFPEWGIVSPLSLGGSGSSVLIYVEDVDATVKRAVEAGAEIMMPPADQFYGDRSSKLKDPSGHQWMFSSRIEEVSPEEMQRRVEKEFGGS